MWIEATFSNKGALATGLSPLVYVYDLADNSLDVNGASMTEIGMGKYKYDFSAADDTKDYSAICDGGVALVGYDRYASGVYKGSIGIVDSNIDAVKAVTDNLPNSGALTDIDTGINNIEAKLPTNYIMGSSSQTDKDDEIDAIKAKTDNLPIDPASETNVDATETKLDALIVTVAALNDISPAEVNAEIIDALATDTYGEPGKENPAATLSMATKIGYLYKEWRNKKQVNKTTNKQLLYNDAGDTVDQERVLNDDGSIFTKNEIVEGT